MEHAVGWAGSVVLLATIGSQIAKQAREKTSQGVSRWLFVGQVTASLLFVIYSLLVDNWVFVVTNTLILLSAIVGVVITARNRRRRPRPSGEPDRPVSPGQRPRTSGGMGGD